MILPTFSIASTGAFSTSIAPAATILKSQARNAGRGLGTFACLQLLPAEQREAYLLYNSGLEVNEIARRTGQSDKAVKQNIVTARMALITKRIKS